MPGSRPPIVIPPDVENVRASPPSPSRPGAIHTSNRRPHQAPMSIGKDAFYQPPPTTFFSGSIGAADNSVSAQIRMMQSRTIRSGSAFGALRRGQPGLMTPGGVPLVGNYGDAIRDAVGWAVVRERPESTAGSNAASGTYRYPSSNMVVGAALAGSRPRPRTRAQQLGAAVTTPSGYPLVGAYGDVIGAQVGQVRERLPSTAGSNAESGTYKYPSRQMRVGAALGRGIEEDAGMLGQSPLVNRPPMLRPPGLAYRGGMAVISSSPSEDRKRILSSLYGLSGGEKWAKFQTSAGRDDTGDFDFNVPDSKVAELESQGINFANMNISWMSGGEGCQTEVYLQKKTFSVSPEQGKSGFASKIGTKRVKALAVVQAMYNKGVPFTLENLYFYGSMKAFRVPELEALMDKYEPQGSKMNILPDEADIGDGSGDLSYACRFAAWLSEPGGPAATAWSETKKEAQAQAASAAGGSTGTGTGTGSGRLNVNLPFFPVLQLDPAIQERLDEERRKKNAEAEEESGLSTGTMIGIGVAVVAVAVLLTRR